MSIGFGIITLTAVLVATTVTAQNNQPAPTQPATVAQLAVGQLGGSGQLWALEQYEGVPARWGNWGLWGSCEGTCGIGVRRRQRICFILRTVATGGTTNFQVPASANPTPAIRQASANFYQRQDGCFGYLIEGMGCQLQPCVNQPSYGVWQAWGTCSRLCGGGSQTRARACLGGSQCPANSLTESRSCNIQPCTVTPQWGIWTDWGACSAPCGGGFQSRSRGCAVGSCPSVGGTDTRQCNTQACVAQYVWGVWGGWGQCSAPCGGGTQSRLRPCASGNCPAGGGAQTQSCNVEPCQVNAFWGQWSAYSICTATCGQGSETRTRVCIGSRNCAGRGSETRSCFVQACVGTWGSWGAYSACTEECGGGTRVRSRPCPAPGNCPGNGIDSQACNEQPCVTYAWALWGEFGACSSACGQGTYTRSRVCLQNNLPSSSSVGCGTQGGQATETQYCYGPPCQSWGSWGLWQGCSATCGPGRDRRSRSCVSNGQQVPAATCTSLTGSAIEERGCNAGPCYSFGEWGFWGQCNAQCGEGSQSRTRPCLADGSPISILAIQTCGSLTGPLSQFRVCNQGPCYSWGSWSQASCSVTCGTGTAKRVRVCRDGSGNPASPTLCPLSDGGAEFEEPCRAGPCFSFGTWTTWGICSAPCGEGSQFRTRQCLGDGSPYALQPGQNCGALGGLLSEARRCIVRVCYSWGEWSAPSCSVTCGSGLSRRVRSCLGINGETVANTSCPNTEGGAVFEEPCQREPCLSWDAWGPWLGCSTCGPGTESRVRGCLSNGQPSPPDVCAAIAGSSIEERPCNRGPCYSFGVWAPWGPCSAPCGEGSQFRVRPCLADGSPTTLSAGSTCGALGGALSESRRCFAQPCYSWSAWSQATCSVSCGVGVSRRTRVCRDGSGNPAANDLCPNSGEGAVFEETCQRAPCVSWNAWGPWQGCSACGPGRETRVRGCLSNGQSASPAACSTIAGSTLEERPCNRGPCYNWSSWTQFTACSATCGDGQSRRTRACIGDGGAVAPDVRACPDPSGLGALQTRACRLAPCYSWQSWSQSSCSVTCGTGVAKRTRRCATRDGKDAPAVTQCPDPGKLGYSIEQPCTMRPCYSWTSWTQYSACTASCGTGQQTRTRRCLGTPGASAPSSASACPDPRKLGTSQTRQCSGGLCFGLGDWESWSRCTSSCGTGTITRRRSCVTSSGVKAPDSACVNYQESDFVLRGTCTRPACPGVWASWSQWEACSQTCNSGTRYRNRQCVRGKCTGIDRDVETCNAVPCQTTQGSGIWSSWSTFGPCTPGCVRISTRTCLGGKSEGDCGSGDFRREIICDPCPYTGSSSVSSSSTSGSQSGSGVSSTSVGSSSSSGSSSATVITGGTGTCVVENSEKRQCVGNDVPREICVTLGCCYDDSYIPEGIPACYYKK